MKTLLACASVLGLGLLVAAPLQAQSVSSTSFQAMPPPSIDDPGTKAVPASSAPSPTGSTADPMTVPVPALPGGNDKDARGEDAPTVKVRKHEGKLIEEYYRGGSLYMVRVQPEHGVPYTYFVDESRKLNRAAGAPPVDPVLYKILEWGQPDKRPKDASD